MGQGRPAKKKRHNFGERLYKIREKSGLTQKQVSQQLGISQRAYSFWERQQVAIYPERLCELANILGISVNELLEDNPKNKKNINLPKSKLYKTFEEASKLPKRQQNKVVEFLEAFIYKKQTN